MGPIAEVSVLQQGVMCGEKYGSLRTLFSEDARPICGIDDTVFCQRMKATALMEGATKLAERAEQERPFGGNNCCKGNDIAFYEFAFSVTRPGRAGRLAARVAIGSFAGVSRVDLMKVSLPRNPLCTMIGDWVRLGGS